MKLADLINDGYTPRKMTRTKEAGETWLLIKKLRVYMVWNHGRDEFTSPVLVGHVEEA